MDRKPCCSSCVFLSSKFFVIILLSPFLQFLIGILDEKTESLRRFEEYFGWKFPSPVAQTCKNNMFYFEWHSGNPHPQLEDKVIAMKIRTLNMWDVALFEYGKQLFQEQEHLFWTSDAGEAT